MSSYHGFQHPLLHTHISTGSQHLLHYSCQWKNLQCPFVGKPLKLIKYIYDVRIYYRTPHRRFQWPTVCETQRTKTVTKDWLQGNISVQNYNKLTFFVTIYEIIPSFSITWLFIAAFFLKPSEVSKSRAIWHLEKMPMINFLSRYARKLDNLSAHGTVRVPN